MRALLFWDNYADYHFQRLYASSLYGAKIGWEVVGVQFNSKVDSHGWSTRIDDRDRLVTLSQGGGGGLAGFVFSLIRFTYNARADVAFIPSYWPVRSAITLLVMQVLGIPVVMMNDSHRGTVRASGVSALVKLLLIKLFSAGFIAGKPQIKYFRELGMAGNSLFPGYDTIDGLSFGEKASDPIFLTQRHFRFKAPTKAILSLGRLIPKKNISVLIDAYNIFRKRVGGGGPALLIVGEGGERSAIKAQAGGLGIDLFEFTGTEDYSLKKDCICLYPFCSNSDAAYFYVHALVFVLASSYEEWGLVVNEALACGTPVLVSDRAGCVEDLVMDGVNGFRFSPHDAEGLSQLLFMMVDDASLGARLRGGARGMASCLAIERFPQGMFGAANYALRHKNAGAII